jgi:hypothetical protein
MAPGRTALGVAAQPRGVRDDEGGVAMPPTRLLFRYSDGIKEWRDPPTVPDLGETLVRRDQEWIVSWIERDSDDTTIVALKRAPNTEQAPRAR